MPHSPSDFLANLIGLWTLTGQMGSTPLQQQVVGKWTLGGLFVELYFKSSSPASEGRLPYEAVYHIGYNADEKLYVLHLLDTFGVGTECIVGLGQSQGDTIPFVFNYPNGPFTNIFIWNEADESWTFEQTYLENRETKLFATKRMVRNDVSETP